ncbi:MAG: PVC-type heme-binding CxxCH protein [Planctomycetaceae bacterium]|nr:PVC-type heme-binding CxxCH protein [Planctomycetaceae bacterium]
MPSFRSVAVLLTACLLLTLPRADVRADDFPEVPNTQQNPPPFTTPEAALKALRLPDGFQATLFAHEPDVRQPIAITTDERGRMWVAENYTYAERPNSFDDKLRDRIIVLEDTDHDGKADKRTVFFDDIQQLTSVEVGFGGVWAMAPPNVLFIPDRNRDDIPDGPPIVVLDGFDTGPANKHNFANGLKWGPDGWLYGRVGITAPGEIGVPGTPKEQRVPVGPSLWRYHPVTKAVEEVCTGTTNPWGHDWDDHGELFFINTVIGHLWHGLHGAHYRRMFGADRNPHVFQVIEQTADHFHWDTAEAWNDIRKGVTATTAQAGGGHAHSGLMIYLGDNWPDQYRGKMMTLNLHGRRINVDRLERHGAGYVGKHESDLIFSDDPWFRPLELIYGPDGGVYVADWSDVGECHENDGVHRTSGRIFKITYGEPMPHKNLDLAKLSSLDLVKLQTHRNDWFVRQARRLLQERTAGGENMAAVCAQLATLFAQDSDIPHKLRAMWALTACGGAEATWLHQALSYPDEYIRSWAVRLLVDSKRIHPKTLAAMEQCAAWESSGLVLLSLSSALQRLPVADRWSIAQAIGSHKEFATDDVLPLMLWYGVEGAITEQPKEAIGLATSTEMPIVRQFIARRLTMELESRPAVVARLVAVASASKSREVQHDLLTGMAQALQGWRQAKAPTAWATLQANINSAGDAELKKLVREISVVFGDGRAIDELLTLAKSTETDTATRRAAIRSLVDAKPPGLSDVLQGLLTDREISPEAVRGLAAVGTAETPKTLVKSYGRLVPPGREAAIQTLASRPQSAAVLLEAIAAGEINRADVPIYLVRQFQGYDDAALQLRLKTIWPELRPISADKQTRIAQMKDKLSRETIAAADVSAGRALWEKSCAKCHVLFGEGGKIGPDITGSQRHNLDYLLENILDPSATLIPTFRMTTLILADGRVINGVVLTKTEQTWEVQTPTEKLTLRKADIEETKDSTQSLMPEGQLDLLSPEEVRNLIGYVMSPQQVRLPTETSGEQ